MYTLLIFCYILTPALSIFFQLVFIESTVERLFRMSFGTILLTSSLSTQTLTTLDLSRNEIGNQGVQDLAKALQMNEVRTILLLITSSLTHFSLRYSRH
jgi:hypothetical protein